VPYVGTATASSTNQRASVWPPAAAMPSPARLKYASSWITGTISEVRTSRRYSENGNNIVHWSEFETGGHFAAMEVPDLLIQDVRTFFRGLR